MPTLFGTFGAVERIPFGADVRDSIGVIKRAASTDVFREITEGPDSTPLATVYLRVADMAYGPVGLSTACTSNCVPTDALLAAVGGESLVFQSMAQTAGGTQFEFVPRQPSVFNMARLRSNAVITQMRAAPGDLDGDGDGDVLYAAPFKGETQFVAIECTGSVNDPNLTNNVDVDADGVKFDTQGPATSVEVEITALVRQPTTWTAPLPQDSVSPILRYTRRVPLPSHACVGPWAVAACARSRWRSRRLSCRRTTWRLASNSPRPTPCCSSSRRPCGTLSRARRCARRRPPA